MATKQEHLVLGGGVIGVTTAYFLARAGCQVTLVERQPGVGLETSFANGSLLTPSMADPWAAPGLPLKLLKWLGRENAPFLVRPAALPGLMSWGLQFLRNCNEATWRRNTEIILRIARYSHEVLQALAAETSIAFDRQSLGTLRLFRDPRLLEAAVRNAKIVGDLDVPYSALTPEACAALEPALTPRHDSIAGGLHFPEDESGDAHIFTQELARRCRELGVVFRFGETVQAIETEAGRVTGVQTDRGRLTAERYVLALGSASPALARPLGIRLPIYPVKGYSMTLSVEGWNGAPRMPILDDDRKMGIVRLGDRLRLAGTAEFTGHDRSPNPRRCAILVEHLEALFPGAPHLERAEPWCGLRPMTPDGIPILGATGYENLWLNVGHGHLGWTMACGSAKAVAALATDEKPELDLGGMTLARA